MTPKTAYSENTWPFFCTGALSIYSATIVGKINNLCPYHCIGSKDNSNFSVNSTCFYKFEDVFFGSCIETMPEVFGTVINQSMGMWSPVVSHFWNNLKRMNDSYLVHTDINEVPGKKLVSTVRGLNKSVTSSMRIYLDNDMFRIHDLYSV